MNVSSETCYPGRIKKLRVLGATSTAEIGAAIAIELDGQIFASISDLQGNIASLACLNGSISQRYQYSRIF